MNIRERLKYHIERAKREGYDHLTVEVELLERLYEDMLVTDIERIKRAKEVLKRRATATEFKEARELLKLYSEIAMDNLSRGNEDERERAEEILYEIHKK